MNIDVNLIKQMYIILIVVASEHEIEIEKFREYFENTLCEKISVELYATNYAQIFHSCS